MEKLFGGFCDAMKKFVDGINPFQKFLMGLGSLGLIERAAELALPHSQPEAVKVVPDEKVGIESHGIEDVPER